jgi:hypothetical protein
MASVIKGKVIVPGTAEGSVLVSDEPLSFWGGYDHRTGEITDRRHPLSGKNAKGRILVLPFTRGSSTTTAVLLESVRAGTAPEAFLLTENDSFIALASIVAKEMYDKPIPIVIVSASSFSELTEASYVQVNEIGDITIEG